MTAKAFQSDIASMGRMWVAAAYDDLRRGGPDRADGVRRILDSYVVPWFGPQTATVGEITYPMVHEWLLTLVGRGRGHSDAGENATVALDQSRAGGLWSLRQAAEAGGVSLPTARRRWRDGELVGAYRDPSGRVCVPGLVVPRLRRDRPVGLSQAVVTDALWVLRRVLGFARANGIVPPGFDPTEGLEAPKPDQAVARSRLPRSQTRPLSFPECARIAAHLHPVHQMVMWLQRVMGLRLSEAFGLLVDDVVDLGDTGLLLVRAQGGRLFQVRDDHGRVVTVPHKERTKTEASSRVLVIPPVMMDLLRVALEAFHADPDSGEADETERLVPGLRRGDEAGQLSFREAFEAAASAEGLGSDDLGFRVSPHLLRKSVATDLAWQPGIEDSVRRRFMGHRAADDVYGRVYTLDHPELRPLEEVAGVLDELIRGSIRRLVVPTTRRVCWGHSNRYFGRAAQLVATLLAAGWLVEPDGGEDPLCDSRRVAAELGVAPTTARRWMRDGTLPCVIVADPAGVERRRVRLGEVWALRDRLAEHVQLPDLAAELGVPYHELYRMSRRLGLVLERHPTSRHFEIQVEAAKILRAEACRVRALHQRSMKLAAAARRLNRAVSTVGLMLRRGELELDPESDSSDARFVTRASVQAVWASRKEHRKPGTAEDAVPVAEVARFTGYTSAELIDLVKAGVLQPIPGRHQMMLTATSLQTWMAQELA